MEAKAGVGSVESRKMRTTGAFKKQGKKDVRQVLPESPQEELLGRAGPAEKP